MCLFDLQANHGGISLSLPKSLQNLFDEETEEEEESADNEEKMDEAEEEEGESVPMEMEKREEIGPLDETWGDISFNAGKKGSLEGNGRQKQQQKELQMNWHICKYLPEEGSCQSCFQVSCHRRETTPNKVHLGVGVT